MTDANGFNTKKPELGGPECLTNFDGPVRNRRGLRSATIDLGHVRIKT